MISERDLKIDTLRGLACLALVFYHTVGAADSGFKIESGLLREVNDYLALIRMPLFTFLSGFVYAYRPYDGTKVGWYVKGKARRLLVPMLFVGTLFAIIQVYTPGTNSSTIDWHTLHIIPVAHFWFVESLFWIFMIIIPLTLIGVMNHKIMVFFLILLFSILSGLGPYTNIFGFNGFIYLAPFFFFGYFLCHFDFDRPTITFAAVLMVIASGLSYLYFTSGFLPRSTLGVLTGLISCYILWSFGLKVKLLAQIGVYSYAIYIFHVFFAAASRILLNNFSEFGLYFNIMVSVALGILGPILLYIAFSRFKYIRFFAFGESLRAK